ncbi:site-specific integrase [Methanobacterium sp. CWC-01]|uniref:tyrosine-type recombinase/integrase n=1 Tax=Methanobacterium aridiramus TaxID=2584467 RepID=UPI0025772F19|nr:site-specific integrase [Methanobacterium sp. CWC-01]WJI10455.1 site-specific integrase [Methanobacterium sp. CWC-01]
MDREDEKIIENWFLRRNISSGTQATYLISLKEYSTIIGKTPYELYQEADEEADAGLRPIKTKVFGYLLQYKKHLMESGKATKTIKLYFSAIRSFYKSFDVPLPDIAFDSGDIGLEKNIGKPLRREDIRKLANAASSRERAMIYLMALSGMGQQEARDLTIQKYIDAASTAIERPLDDVYDLFKFEDDIVKEILILHITRRKVKYRYITFIPPEASREIIHYLKERCFGRNEKIRIKNNQDHIFVGKNGGQMSRDSVVTNFRRIGQLAGFKREKGSYSSWRSHALRKYFISTLINKKGNKIIADFMAGHKISEQDRTYWQANPEDLKNMYQDALPFLSLDEAKVKDVETEGYRELKEENIDLKSELNQVKIKLASLGDFAKFMQDPDVKKILENKLPKEEDII